VTEREGEENRQQGGGEGRVDIGKIGITMTARVDSKISSPKSKTFSQ
jgi:hypothetical protein